MENQPDDFGAFRGFFWGVIFAMPLWVAIGVAVWWCRRG